MSKKAKNTIAILIFIIFFIFLYKLIKDENLDLLNKIWETIWSLPF